MKNIHFWFNYKMNRDAVATEFSYSVNNGEKYKA